MASKSDLTGMNLGATYSPHAPSVEERSALSNQSKCAIVAFVIGGVAGIIIVALGATNMFGSVDSIGFIASIAGGGLLTLIAGGGLIWMAIANCKRPNRQEVSQDTSPSPLVQGWQQLLTMYEGKAWYTNVHRYADQCIDQLAHNNVPMDGYDKLMVWQPERCSPDVFSPDGIAPNLCYNMEALKPRSILLIVIVDSDSRETNPGHSKQAVLRRKLSNARGPNSPVVLHFVNVEKPLFGPPKIHLSPQQCKEIANHLGEDLSVIT